MDHQFQPEWVDDRASELVAKRKSALHRSADRTFIVLGFVQWIAALGVAAWITPGTWIGETIYVDAQFSITVSLGGLLALIPYLMTRLFPAAPATRHLIAASQMGWSLLFIHLSGGRLETHFHIFGSLALLSFYRDWKLLLTATLVVAIDHGLRGAWWPMSVFGIESASPFRWIEHTAWILCADLFLALACARGNRLDDQLCRRQAELEQINKNVEQIVWSRTKDLKEANRKLKGEVKTRVKAETEREKLTRKLILASRQAGMSEVATGVLHSVGNVINSINVSTDTILDQLDDCRIDRLKEAVDLIPQDADQLARFLADSMKGQRVVDYLAQVTDKLRQQLRDIHKEVVSMRSNVAHVVEIVAMQQTYASVGGVSEEFAIHDVCEDAIHINLADDPAAGISVVRDYGDLPLICTERHKVLQILVNLINNSKYAVTQTGCLERRIEIATSIQGNVICVRVKDSGVGIPEVNLAQIFQHGFTTRKDGHGFGLHSSVLTAHELNGNLECACGGEGQGAEFVLTLPVSEVAVARASAPKYVIPSFNSNPADAHPVTY
jgi:signal transduction histidine kinase